MRLAPLLAVCASLVGTALAARDPRHLGRGANVERLLERRAPASSPPGYGQPSSGHHNKTIIKQTPKTKKFKVNGKKIPDVDFDIGESYAGLLPISNQTNASELYFWFFPSPNPKATDEIVIWLNGGPGCSSLEGLLQENGVFLWQYGTYRPVKNNWNWVNLTNIVWIEQPAGTGFSQINGSPQAQNEIEVAEQFLGFWKNFIDTFDFHNKKIYITGESYAGYYVPYIADAMHNQSDTKYYGVDSIMIYDPSTSYDVLQQDIPTIPFIEYWAPLFSLNDSYVEYLQGLHESCGYREFMEKAMVFPPTGPLPTPPNYDYSNETCTPWYDVIDAASLVNPCWDVYQVATTCPNLWDVLGFPGSFYYSPPGASIYFNRTDVQKAINAPIQEWSECADGILLDEGSPPSGLSILPRVIEKNTRTVIGHGMLDMILLMNGTVMMIQNMTWNGAQGFSTPPSQWEDFYVPYHSELNLGSTAGAGYFGQFHTERGLTFCTVDLSGHMVPQYAPSAAYRQLEFLLGRIESLGEVSDFTTQTGDFGNDVTNATYKMF